MSATVLRQSTVGGDLTKEAAFQQLFLQGLAFSTSFDCSFCPELSKIFPKESNIAGEVDFYLNGRLRWGIELLVNGVGVGEHLNRFSPNGKYSALAVNDYSVVDFRGNASGQPTNVDLFSKRISVFFKTGDYTVARCLIGQDPAVKACKLNQVTYLVRATIFINPRVCNIFSEFSDCQSILSQDLVLIPLRLEVKLVRTSIRLGSVLTQILN